MEPPPSIKLTQEDGPLSVSCLLSHMYLDELRPYSQLLSIHPARGPCLFLGVEERGLLTFFELRRYTKQNGCSRIRESPDMGERRK